MSPRDKVAYGNRSFSGNAPTHSSYLTDLVASVHRFGHQQSGRLSIFGAQTRVDCSNDCFPYTFDEKVDQDAVVAEVLMMVRGISNVRGLNALGIHTLDAFAVKPDTGVTFATTLEKKGLITALQAPHIVGNFDEDIVGELGVSHGLLWRSWPKSTSEINRLTIQRTVAELPSDLNASLAKSYAELPKEDSTDTSLETWLLTHYYSVFDQLNELVNKLKSGNYLQPFLVTAYSPEFEPIDAYAPDVNVMLGRSSYFPKAHAFQCYVATPKEPGGRPRLSLKVSVTSLDLINEAPHVLSTYALLLHLLAHTVSMDVDELIADLGDAYLLDADVETLFTADLLMGNGTPLSRIRINPGQRDLFQMTFDDFSITSLSTLEDEHHVDSE